MRAPYTELYLHCVWATWDRLPLVTDDIEARLYAAIAAKCRELKCVPLAIGGVEDHVHLVVRLHTTVSVAQLLKGVKGSSSHLVTERSVLASFLITLRPTGPAPLGRHLGRSLHGLLINLLADADPALADRLHSPMPIKPFTVSTLLGRLSREGGRPVATPDQLYRRRPDRSQRADADSKRLARQIMPR